jgi:hypothetical protein
MVAAWKKKLFGLEDSILRPHVYETQYATTELMRIMIYQY